MSTFHSKTYPKVFLSCRIELENKISSVEYICDIIEIEGTYNVKITDALKLIIGDIDVHGKGLAGLKISKYLFFIILSDVYCIVASGGLNHVLKFKD